MLRNTYSDSCAASGQYFYTVTTNIQREVPSDEINLIQLIPAFLAEEAMLPSE